MRKNSSRASYRRKTLHRQSRPRLLARQRRRRQHRDLRRRRAQPHARDLPLLRQQQEKPADQFNHSLADFIAPKDSGRLDYLGGFAVTAGHGVEQLAAEFRAQHDDYSAIMAQALGDRLAEALAELMHKKARDF
jgi:cobalamin-dependent methionine synthase I